MSEVAEQITPDAWQMCKIAILAVPQRQPRENAEDLGVALRAKDGIGLREGEGVETRVRFRRRVAIAGVESALALLGHIEPPILQKGDEVVGGMAPNGVLEVDHAKPPQTASLLAQKEVGRMVVSQEEVLLLLPKPIEKGRPRFEKCAGKRLRTAHAPETA